MAAFQKRHYEIVAALLGPIARKARAGTSTDADVDKLVADFADCFQADNPLFRRLQFADAVYPPDIEREVEG